MKLSRKPAVPWISLLALLPFTVSATSARAQNDAGSVACPDTKVPSAYQTFFLNHVTDRQQFQEIQTVLRNDLVQNARINGDSEQYAFAICGTPAELQLAQKIIADLDRPRKTWRLTYTFARTDSGQNNAPRHISLVASEGQRAELRQGDRVPIVTGATGTTGSESSPSSQVQYVDVGLSLSATVAGDSGNPELHTKVEQSSVADEKSGIGAQDPILHQTVLDVSARLVPGKPLTLGSLDLPGTTQHEEVQVTVEPVP